MCVCVCVCILVLEKTYSRETVVYAVRRQKYQFTYSTKRDTQAPVYRAPAQLSNDRFLKENVVAIHQT